MTKTEKNTHVNLAAIVHESEEAAKAAAEAQAKAMAAKAKAEAAKERAEAEQVRANEQYLRVLESEYTENREQALTKQGEARQALEAAVVAGDADIFARYWQWVRASLDAWAVESALEQQRYFLGRPTRPRGAPTFSFTHDIGAIIDHHSAELQEEALERIRERRAAFLSGQENS